MILATLLPPESAVRCREASHVGRWSGLWQIFNHQRKNQKCQHRRSGRSIGTQHQC